MRCFSRTVLFLILISPVLVSASFAAATKAKPAAKKVVSAVCPVDGKVIPNVAKTQWRAFYKGKSYYFCSFACRKKFNTSPVKYVGKQAVAKPAAKATPAAKKPIIKKPALQNTTANSDECVDGVCPIPGIAQPSANAKSVSAVCPVTKKVLPDVSKVTEKTVYQGKTYYFASADAKKKFVSNPYLYVK